MIAMNLFDLLLTVCIRFLAWVFTAPGRYRVARQRWNYTRYQAALAALFKYVWGYANALNTHRKWKAYTEDVIAQEALIQRDINVHGFWVSKDGRRVDPALIMGVKWGRAQYEGCVFHGIADVLKPVDINIIPNANFQTPLSIDQLDAMYDRETRRRQRND